MKHRIPYLIILSVVFFIAITNTGESIGGQVGSKDVLQFTVMIYLASAIYFLCRALLRR